MFQWASQLSCTCHKPRTHNWQSLQIYDLLSKLWCIFQVDSQVVVSFYWLTNLCPTATHSTSARSTRCVAKYQVSRTQIVKTICSHQAFQNPPSFRHSKDWNFLTELGKIKNGYLNFPLIYLWLNSSAGTIQLVAWQYLLPLPYLALRLSQTEEGYRSHYS